MPKFTQCLSTHGYSFGPHFTRLIQSKVLMLVKLSLLVCIHVCVVFFYLCKLIHSITSDQRWTNWDSRGMWTRSKSIPSLDTVWPRSTGPIISDIIMFAYRGVKCPFNFTISYKTRKFILKTGKLWIKQVHMLTKIGCGTCIRWSLIRFPVQF